MSDVPKVPDKNWRTELTGEVQPVSDRDQRRSQREAQQEQKQKREDRVTLSGEEPADAKPRRPDEEPPEKTSKEQRGDDEPGRIIDLEA